MIRYIAFFDRTAGRYCSDLIPCDDSEALMYRLAKRFTFNKYCSFVKPVEIELHLVAKWDSENPKKPIELCNKKLFTLDRVDELYKAYARSQKVEGVTEVTVPTVETEKNYGDFVRDIEKKQLEENNNGNA